MTNTTDSTNNPKYEPSINERYEEWVEGQYQPQMIDLSMVPDIKMPSEAGRFSMLDRLIVYLTNRDNVILDGHTGTGKSTIVQAAAGLLERPLYIEDGTEKLNLDSATQRPTLRGDNAFIHPGQLTSAIIFDGIYHIQEGANMLPKNIVGFHEVFDRGFIHIPTHEGVVNYLLRDGRNPNFAVVLTGNFSYQKPAFTPATTQRFVWMQFPYIEGDQLSQMLTEHHYTSMANSMAPNGNTGKLDEKIIHDLRDKLTQVYGDREHPLQSKAIEAAAKMLTTLDSELRRIEGGPEDINRALLKRAMTIYSPELTVDEYAIFLRETVLFPAVARRVYEGERDALPNLESKTRDVLSRYKNLFADGGQGFRPPKLGLKK